MKVRNIEPNLILSIKNIQEVEGRTKVVFLDDRGNLKEANLVIENLDNKKMVQATLKDWENFQNMLVETAVPTAVIQKMELEFNKQIDEKIKYITARFATEPQNIATLAVELGELTSKKSEIVTSMIEEKKEKLREEAKNRKNFFVGGIMKFEKDNEINRVVEIPQPSKTRRNMRNLSSNDAIMNYSFSLNGKPLIVGDLKDLDISKVRIHNTLNVINNENVIKEVFDVINNNCIDGLGGDKKEFLLNKLINVYGDSELSKELYSFKKELTPETLTEEAISKLKDLYVKIKEDILVNGLEKYTIEIPIQYSVEEKQKLLDRMVKGISESLLPKLTGENVLPNEVELKNIVATHKLPTNIINGQNVADQWYGAIKMFKDIGNGKKGMTEISNVYTVEETIKQVKYEAFSSITIENQIREIVKKGLELENKEKEIEEEPSIDR